jgi:tetratricopeptide (TPR) repeat protein
MPEKLLSQVARPIREQYEKGKSALSRQNYDYAVAIFTQVLEQEPGFYECREALRASQHKKAEKGGTGFFKKILSGAGSSPLLAKGQLALRMQPSDALKIAEQILNSDPQSGQGHKLLADAALACDLPKTAVLSLEILAKQSPKDIDIQKELAQAYGLLGQGEKAERIYTELIRQRPNDLKLLEELKDISARKTLAEGGYEALAEGKGSYRDILKDKDQAVALEQEHRQVKSEDVAQRLIDDLLIKIQAEPNNIKHFRTLGDLYLQKKEYDKALEAFNKVATLEGGADPATQKLIADTTVKKLDQASSQLDTAAPDYAEKSAQLKSERDKYLLTECKERADRYPNDLAIRYELGTLYFQAGKITEAIQEFQKAQNNPHRRIQALTYIGRCHSRRNMNDMAARAFQTALKEKQGFDDEKKEIIYELGLVLEKMGKKEEAIEQFKQIYEADVGFRDVAAKIDAYYGGS